MASTHYIRECSRRASERGKRMAAERWRRDREQRDLWASIAPERMPAKIVRRIIVIDSEVIVREAVMYDTDSMRDARRKLRQVLTTTATKP